MVGAEEEGDPNPMMKCMPFSEDPLMKENESIFDHPFTFGVSFEKYLKRHGHRIEHQSFFFFFLNYLIILFFIIRNGQNVVCVCVGLAV